MSCISPTLCLLLQNKQIKWERKLEWATEKLGKLGKYREKLGKLGKYRNKLGFDVLYLTPHVLVPLGQLLLPLLLKLLAVHYLPTLQSSVRNLSCSETFQIRSAREAHACSARRGLAVKQIQSWSFNAVLFISHQSSCCILYKENLPYHAKVKS